jgi:hypothetical protein
VSSSKEHRTDAGGTQAKRPSYLAVRGALDIGEPQHLSIAQRELGHRTTDIGTHFDRFVVDRRPILLRNLVGLGSGAPEMIVHEVGGDAVEVVAPVVVIVPLEARSEVTQVCLLEEIVGKSKITAAPRQVGPEGTRRALMEAAERRLIHDG